MSVRECLLAILDQGPCYGYQLRAEFDRRTGSMSPLNVGQVYNTLDRLERDGFVAKAGADDQGHVFYEITDGGRSHVREWLHSPAERQPARDELAEKMALVSTLPGVDVRRLIQTQLAASGRALAELSESRREAAEAADAVDLAGILLREARAYHAEADVRWLEHVADVLQRAPRVTQRPVPLDVTPVKRGRPARAVDAADRDEAVAV